eukprot:547406-Pelagomonas_calceolata.AAC.5
MELIEEYTAQAGVHRSLVQLISDQWTRFIAQRSWALTFELSIVCETCHTPAHQCCIPFSQVSIQKEVSPAAMVALQGKASKKGDNCNQLISSHSKFTSESTPESTAL